jgi:RNA polymerase sigma factor for flagellar operon FliA
MLSPARAYGEQSLRDRRNGLILGHLSLVRHIAARQLAELPPGVDLENLEAAGVLGLVEAANNFDLERGTQFKTFAYTRIRGAILDELRRNSILPQQMLQMVGCVRRAFDALPPPVTVEALAAATGLTEDEVADCLAAIRLTRVSSLDGGLDAVGTRLDDPACRPDAIAEKEEQVRLLASALTRLEERERVIVTLYYLEDLRLKEIGEVLNLSESRVSRLLNGALFHLGELLRSPDPLRKGA